LWVERADDAAVGEGGRVLIVGAGRSGRSYAREVRETPGQRVVGFLDDNPAIQSRRISGFRVRGALSDAGRVVAESSATEVVVTIANASDERLTTVIAACEEAGIPCRVVRRRIDSVSLPTGVPAE
jgi:FlaA1/EpsC-like NDP-sugar epimerase